MKKITTLLLALLLLTVSGRVAAQNITQNTMGQTTPALVMSFGGQVSNKIAQLFWTMEDETNDKWFVIERAGSTNGYDSIGVVYAINNNNETNYNFVDASMLNGTNTYRLRQVDRDGIVRYSKLVTLQNVVASTSISVYPNPAIATLNYSLITTAPEQVTVQIYSLSGVIVMTAQQSLSAGSNQQSVAINHLKSGNYILKVSTLNGNSRYVQPFVKLL